MWHFHDKRIPLITWTSSWVHSLPCFKAVEHRLQACSSCSSPTCEKAVKKTRCFLSFSTKLEQWGGGWALDGREFHRGGATCIRPLMLTVLGRLGADAHITGGFGSRRWTSSQIPWSPMGTPLCLLPLLLLTVAAVTQTIVYCLLRVHCLPLLKSVSCLSGVSITYYSSFFKFLILWLVST